MNAKMKKKSKNPPYFSHEYVIQNHGDIVSFICMIIVVGFMFKLTSPVAALFVKMNHNVSTNGTTDQTLLQYTAGRLDVFACVFYTLICVVVHAVIQEYVLDKLNKKLHLSKTKFSKFNESGQLVVFYLVSVFWACHNIYHEKLITGLNSLWQPYPSIPLPFWVKVFFIMQISYWLHGFPELYFQKVKKEEIPGRVIYTTLYLFGVTAGYALNFGRLTMVLLSVCYLVDFMFHTCRLIHFTGRTKLSRTLFFFWNILFVVARLTCIIAAYITFHFGLQKSSVIKVDLSEGNFNTRLIRLNGLAFIFVTQAYMMWNFINFHIRRRREQNQAAKAQTIVQNFSQKKKAGSVVEKKRGRKDDEDLSDLPEADQNHQKELRQRGKNKAR